MHKRVKKTDYETVKTYGGYERIKKPRGRKVFVGVDSTFQAFGKRYIVIHDMGKGCKSCSLNGKCEKYKKYFGSCRKSERPDGFAVVFLEIGKC